MSRNFSGQTTNRIALSPPSDKCEPVFLPLPRPPSPPISDRPSHVYRRPVIHHPPPGLLDLSSDIRLSSSSVIISQPSPSQLLVTTISQPSSAEALSNYHYYQSLSSIASIVYCRSQQPSLSEERSQGQPSKILSLLRCLKSFPLRVDSLSAQVLT